MTLLFLTRIQYVLLLMTDIYFTIINDTMSFYRQGLMQEFPLNPN